MVSWVLKPGKNFMMLEVGQPIFQVSSDARATAGLKSYKQGYSVVGIMTVQLMVILAL